MSDQNTRYTRLRYTAAGALAALAATGAIAGTGALANTNGHPAVAKGGATKTPASPGPDKTRAPQPPVNPQSFLNAIQQLVDNGRITATQAHAVDREIQAGRIETGTLTGFTQPQLQAVEQALVGAKRGLAAAVAGGPRAPKEPPPAGTGNKSPSK